MSTVSAGERPPPTTEEQLLEMRPIVLELQKLLQARILRGLRSGDEVASISLTSCDHHSCN
jgi:hypothetical protein